MERRWITVQDAADYLSIHPVTCRRLIDQGRIPASRVGRSVRIDLRELNRRLEQNKTSD